MGNLSPRDHLYLRGSARVCAGGGGGDGGDSQSSLPGKKKEKGEERVKGPPPPMAIPAPSTPQPPRRPLVGLKKRAGWSRSGPRRFSPPFRRFDTGW